MASYLFDKKEVSATIALISLLAKVKDLDKATEVQTKSLKINRDLLTPLANSVLMDNYLFNPIFEGKYTSTQIAVLMNYQKLYRKKVETTNYSKSYFKTHFDFRVNKKARQRHGKAYNEVIFNNLYLTDVEFADWKK